MHIGWLNSSWHRCDHMVPNSLRHAHIQGAQGPVNYCVHPVYLLLATYYLLPTTDYLLPTTYYLLPTTYYLLFTMYYLLPTTYYLPLTTYYLLFATYYSPLTAYYLLFTTYSSIHFQVGNVYVLKPPPGALLPRGTESTETLPVGGWEAGAEAAGGGEAGARGEDPSLRGGGAQVEAQVARETGLRVGVNEGVHEEAATLKGEVGKQRAVSRFGEAQLLTTCACTQVLRPWLLGRTQPPEQPAPVGAARDGGGGDGASHDALSLQSTAPECLLGSEHPRTCGTLVWSLGILLQLLLTGDPPFIGQSAPQLLQQVFSGVPPTLRLSAATNAFLRGLLHPDPQKRVSAREALKQSWLRMPYEEIYSEAHLQDTTAQDAPRALLQGLHMAALRDRVDRGLGRCLVLAMGADQ